MSRASCRTVTSDPIKVSGEPAAAWLVVALAAQLSACGGSGIGGPHHPPLPPPPTVPSCGIARGGDLPAAVPAPPPSMGPAPVAGAPYVLYTDLVAGPTRGGENDKGVYLSIFGSNFGTSIPGAVPGTHVKVFIGGVEVDNYRTLGPSKGRGDIGQITVQVGALGDPPTGVELPIQVVVNGVGSNTNHTFMVQPGDILFVDNINGDDATAVKNDITRPWRHVQTPDSCPEDCFTESGALSPGVVNPGDVVVMRGRGRVWSDVGVENRFARFRHETGTRPSGTQGDGYITLMAYPGEDVHIVPQPNTLGGIHGVDGDAFPDYSKWIVISGLRIEGGDGTVSDGPINLQAHSDRWRIVNNELFNWAAPATAKSAGISGNGTGVAILGNRIHDIGGGVENHGMYFDTGATDLDVAYNEIANIQQGNLIQTFDNLGTGELNNLNIHHNLLHDGGRYGLNISGGTHSLNAWNNVIYNTAFAGVRFSVKSNPSSNFMIIHNTLYNNSTRIAVEDTHAPILNDWDLNSGSAIIANNIVYSAPLAPSLSLNCYFIDSGDGSAIHIKRNLWYGRLRGAPPPQDLDPVGGLTDVLDPLFVNPQAGNFNLLPGSPAIQQAIATVPFGVVDDYRQMPRPTASAPDVGAYQYAR